MTLGLAIPGTAPDGRFLPGSAIAGRYVVQRELGAGATGAVYEVHDAVLPERRLALKIMHRAAASPQEFELQRDELRSMVQVRHPSIIALYDHGYFEGRLYSVLPIMRGEALEGREWSRAEVHRIGVMLCEALAALHGVGLTHQDIKPENARLTQFDGVPHPTPILLDLGTAVRIGTPMRGFSPAYIAPEVAEALGSGRTPIADPKADVYSMALTLHALLETPPEETSENLMIFLAKRGEGEPPRFRRKDLAFLDESFARFLHKDPAMRPTAAELARALDVLLLPERRRRRMIQVAGLSAVVAVVLGVAGVFVHRATERADRAHEAARIAREEQARAERVASSAQTELSSTRGELEGASGRVDRLTRDAERLALEAQKNRTDAESWEVRARRLDKAVDELTGIIGSLRNALGDERRLRDEYAAQVQDRERQLQQAESRQRETAAARDEAAGEAARVAVRAEALEAALHRVEADLVDARAALEREQATHASATEALRSRVERAEAAVAEATAELERCKDRLGQCVAASSGGGGGAAPAP